MALNIFRKIFDKFTQSRRSSTGPFGRLPQELLDHIISYLADDKASLLSCALVHPTWTRISRYYCPPLTLSFYYSGCAERLIKRLRSSRETFSSCIAGITLVGMAPFHDTDMNDKDPRARAYRNVKADSVRAYSKLMHVLKTKGVILRSGVVWNEPSLVGLFAQYFPQLVSLKVVCASHKDMTSFMRALAGSFPLLAELSIKGGFEYVEPDVSLDGLGDLRLAMPCLRTLRVIGWNNELVRWLGDNVVGTLERLELESASLGATFLGEANLLIQGNKDTLRDLRLTFVKRDVTFDLSALTRLENLEVTSGIRDSYAALNGWRLPMSLKKVHLRNAVRILHTYWYRTGVWDDLEESVKYEGTVLQAALANAV